MKCYEYTICDTDFTGETFVGLANDPKHFFELLYTNKHKNWDKKLEGKKPKFNIKNYKMENLKEIPVGSFSYSSW